MGNAITKLREINAYHVPAYQLRSTVRHAALSWQAARQRRMEHLALQDMSFGTLQGIEAQFTEEDDEAENAFFNETNDLAKKQHALAWLSKSGLINSLTALILTIWFIVLLGSILPINTGTDAGKRDLTEALLEVGEKFLAFAAVTAKTYWWRLATFGFVAGFSIIKKGFEVHVDPAPDRVAGPNWAFAGALIAKAFEHIAYAVRLTPTKAWDSTIRESKYISAEQWVRRSMWAASYYREYLLIQQRLRNKIDKRPGH